ncbi:MAG: 4Fe-4S binding protein [Verrucomicrobiales bacterium]|nr:4Fe-4S binding protein [Verrucomicrobiales bacterium]
MSLSRRGLLGSFLRPLKAGGEKAKQHLARSPFERTDQVAVIQGRHCLAYQEECCTVCYEKCPVPQALELNEGVPRIILEICTGCGLCRDVCPAPTNAIMLADRKPGFGA